MRRPALVILPFLFACGDNLASPDLPDAAPVEPTPDADVPVDAPPTPGPASRVWIVGGIFDQRWLAGSFVESNVDVPTLPFSAANPPPVTAPDEGFFPSWQLPFSVSRDRIAYAGTAPGASTIHLWSANLDGSDPVIVGRSLGARPWFLSNATSPDGRKVDHAQRYDLYVARTDGEGEPIRISPPRPAAVTNPDALDVTIHIAWSPDSRYVAFTGDLTEDGVHQAYVTDVSVEAPTAVEFVTRDEVTVLADPRGAIGAPMFDSDNRVYFRARLTGSVELFRAVPGRDRTRITLPARLNTTASDAGPFTVDGSTLYAAADVTDPGHYDLFSIPFAGDLFGTPTNLTRTGTRGEIDGFTPIVVSPDGTHVGFVANYDAAGLAWEPYVVATDNSGMHRLVNALDTCPGCSQPRALRMQWTADSSALYLIGRLVESSYQAYRVDACLSDQQPQLVFEKPAPNAFSLHVIVQPL